MWSSQKARCLALGPGCVSIFSSAALFFTRNKLRHWPLGDRVMMGNRRLLHRLFWFAPWTSIPFAQLNPAPSDGSGSNRCCSHPAMMIHPPVSTPGSVA